MTKMEADGLKKISTTFLKKHGYFSESRTGIITWTSSWSERTNSVGIDVFTNEHGNYLRVHYTQTDHDTGNKKDCDYKIPLTSTLCRYGGKRYWFICPMTANGRYCDRRVAVLYLGGTLFACRHCYNLTYASRNASERYKGFVSIPDLDEQEAKIKRWYYRGKPTRQHRKFIKMNDKFERSFYRAAFTLGILGNDFKVK